MGVKENRNQRFYYFLGDREHPSNAQVLDTGVQGVHSGRGREEEGLESERL